jgi:hypothetical protein
VDFMDAQQSAVSSFLIHQIDALFCPYVMNVIFTFVTWISILSYVQALTAFAEGKAALNEYIRIADEGLMLELNKIDQI